jgi:AraC-like DNA-binding protein
MGKKLVFIRVRLAPGYHGLVDVVSGLLANPRAREAFVVRIEMDLPWAISVEDEAPLTLVAVTAGQAWLERADQKPRPLDAGDIALVRGPEHYRLADTPGQRTTVVARANGDCRAVPGEDLVDSTWLGVRTWGNTTDGEAKLLVGTYLRTSEVGRRLLASLPAVVVVPAAAGDRSVVELLTRESQRDDPGQSVVLDRLLDLALVATIRTYIATAEPEAPGWSRAHQDPETRRAVEMIHDDPARAWTVASLGDAVGLSRAALARRFAQLVGVPPMTYLTQWRLTLASDLLADPSIKLDQAAREVGYGTAYALSAAFKRELGVSPREYRRSLAA